VLVELLLLLLHFLQFSQLVDVQFAGLAGSHRLLNGLELAQHFRICQQTKVQSSDVKIEYNAVGSTTWRRNRWDRNRVRAPPWARSVLRRLRRRNRNPRVFCRSGLGFRILRTSRRFSSTIFATVAAGRGHLGRPCSGKNTKM
jgi:hypothetical protein